MSIFAATAIFSSNPILDPFFSLDAALSALWLETNHPELYYGNTHILSPLLDCDLPLEKDTNGDVWWYRCSSMMYTEEPISDKVFWTKRWDTCFAEYLYIKRQTTINSALGATKNYHMPLFPLGITTGTWIIDGDMEKIKNDLQFIDCLGKKRITGRGRVKEWIVKECQELEHLVSKRPLPIGFSIKHKNGILQECGYRAPYWHKERKCLCSCPSFDDLRIER